MTEFETLLVVLAAVYLACCAAWVPRAAFVFRTRFTRRFRCAPANALLGGERGALAWCEPLPPFGVVFVAEPLPFSIGAEGVLAWIAAAQPGGVRPWQATPRLLAWSEVRSAEARECLVVVNGTRFVACGSRELAAHAARLLEQLARASEPERERKLERELERAFDTVAISDAAGRAERATERLAAPAAGLFALVFVMTPLVALFGDIHHQWPWLVIALVVLHAWAVVELWLAAGRVARADRWRHVLHGAPSPIGIIRARDGLTRDRLALYAPLAVAKVLCEDRFELLLRATLRDARHPWRPACPLDDERARRVEAEWRARLVRAHTRLAPKLAADPGAPARLADDCIAYCARCESQYTKADALCNVCGDRTLTPFAGAATIDGDLGSR